MTTQTLINLVYDRAARWGRKLIMHNATPFITIGVGHGPNSGQLILCTVEDMSNDNLKTLLKAALSELDRK